MEELKLWARNSRGKILGFEIVRRNKYFGLKIFLKVLKINYRKKILDLNFFKRKNI